MATDKPGNEMERQARIMADIRRDQEQWQNSYRERALKLFPWVCARCTREFDGRKVSELTVHHKDHNHDNNPPDGSNWELLCIYCHDHEHQRGLADPTHHQESARKVQKPTTTHQPFADLARRLRQQQDNGDGG